MKVLLSAYACEPNKGSEPGVGWNWALELARLGHEVWVLTRANNQPAIDRELDETPTLPNLHFVYYDLPRWLGWWKKGRRGIHLYYLLWQWGAYRLARSVHARERFDRVQHITFVSARQPSFMGNLGIPFILGPVGGGEQAPWRLRFGYGARGWLLDALRDLANHLVRFGPLMRRSFRQAERIYVTSEQTRALMPRRYQTKAKLQLAIGWESNARNCNQPPIVPNPEDRAYFRVLYVGCLIYWKGMHLGLPAFARLTTSHPFARLTIVGSGPEERRWRQLAQDLRISDRVEWVPWLEREILSAFYASHHVLLYPSLHDSGGMVVLEAMAHGRPVVCLDLGGPGAIVDGSCGRVISTRRVGRSNVIEALGHALIEIAEDTEQFDRLAAGALARAREYEWGARVTRFYSGVQVC